MLKITTPKGIAGFMNLVRPDTRFDPEGKYKVNITLAADDAAGIIQSCNEVATHEFGPKKAAQTKMPGKENEDGSVTFTFKSKSKPNVYDARVTLIEPERLLALRIGSGSTIRVNGGAEAYENGARIGVTLSLHEVQIIHLKQYQAGGFEADDEGTFIYRSGSSARSIS
ncbi:hypothetical protein AB3X94_06475 [Paraburkholderia sp. BR10923]|uniref:hypothetical protein n=1 Tax=Paraburkholderia sp. BR10923 TaxID=3236992 RepID=UPI0034D002E6